MKLVIKNFMQDLGATVIPYSKGVFVGAAEQAGDGGLPIDYTPPVQRSIIGSTVVNLDRGRRRLVEQEAALTTEIERMTEELRQTKGSLASVNMALLLIADDPALTDGEREMAQAAADDVMDCETANIEIGAVE